MMLSQHWSREEGDTDAVKVLALLGDCVMEFLVSIKAANTPYPNAGPGAGRKIIPVTIYLSLLILLSGECGVTLSSLLKNLKHFLSRAKNLECIFRESTHSGGPT